jgi:hypothetical protein
MRWYLVCDYHEINRIGGLRLRKQKRVKMLTRDTGNDFRSAIDHRSFPALWNDICFFKDGTPRCFYSDKIETSRKIENINTYSMRSSFVERFLNYEIAK